MRKMRTLLVVNSSMYYTIIEKYRRLTDTLLLIRPHFWAKSVKNKVLEMNKIF